MKTIGIIGGLGPETTAKFYLKLIEKCAIYDKLKRPAILTWSIPLEYKIEENLIKKGTDLTKYIPYMTEAAKRLEAGGADFIVIPCNSVHIHIDKIRQSVKIPVLSIIEETVHFLSTKNISNVAMLATTATIKTKLYETSFYKNNIEVLTPNKNDQKIIGDIVARLATSSQTEKDIDNLHEVISRLNGTQAILLACTDLQLVIDKYKETPIFDTMEILADATVKEYFTFN